MLWPMVLHAAGAIVLGVAPELAIAAIRAVLMLFPVGDPDTILVTLGPLVWASRILAIALLVVGVHAYWRGRAARRSATWGCGYTGASARMQYTGSSFSEQFTRIFESFLPSLRREKLPTEPFPQASGHIATHHVDAVERRMFEVLGRGENMVSNAAEKIPEQPRFAFAAGLVTIVVIAALVIVGVTR
jgi:hypothetical protein